MSEPLVISELDLDTTAMEASAAKANAALEGLGGGLSRFGASAGRTGTFVEALERRMFGFRYAAEALLQGLTLAGLILILERITVRVFAQSDAWRRLSNEVSDFFSVLGGRESNIDRMASHLERISKATGVEFTTVKAVQELSRLQEAMRQVAQEADKTGLAYATFVELLNQQSKLLEGLMAQSPAAQAIIGEVLGRGQVRAPARAVFQQTSPFFSTGPGGGPPTGGFAVQPGPIIQLPLSVREAPMPPVKAYKEWNDTLSETSKRLDADASSLQSLNGYIVFNGRLLELQGRHWDTSTRKVQDATESQQHFKDALFLTYQQLLEMNTAQLLTVTGVAAFQAAVNSTAQALIAFADGGGISLKKFLGGMLRDIAHVMIAYGTLFLALGIAFREPQMLRAAGILFAGAAVASVAARSLIGPANAPEGRPAVGVGAGGQPGFVQQAGPSVTVNISGATIGVGMTTEQFGRKIAEIVRTVLSDNPQALTVRAV